MEARDIITLIISVISLLISIFVYRQTYMVNRYEFTSAEATKKDIMNLFSALHMIMEKGTHIDLMNMNCDREKNMLMDFLLSDTWCITRSVLKDNDSVKMANERFLGIIYGDDFVGDIARLLIGDINKIYSEYYEKIIEEKNRLNKNICKFSEEDTFNSEWYDNYRRKEQEDHKRCILEIQLLKKKGIEDPDLDFWLGALTGDSNLIKAAIKKGADVNSRLHSVIDKYLNL